MKSKRIDTWWIKVIAGMALIWLVSITGFAAEPVKLGVAGVHSGELAPYGISGLRGVKLALTNINANGGLLGQSIELMVEDDLCKPNEATIVASKLVVDGAHAVIGHICSGATVAALETYREERIIVISPSATNPDLTRSGHYPNFFRTIAPDDRQARAQVDFTLGVLGRSKIAVLHDKGVYGKGLAEYVKTFLEESDKGTMVLYEGIAPTTADYSMLAQKINRFQADAVIFGGYHPAAVKVLAEMRKKRLEIAFVAGDGIKDDAFIATAGPYAEGVYATAPKDTSRLPMAVDAAQAHQSAYGESPGAFYFTAYAATLALANAIEKAGSTDYDAVSKVLRSEYVETPIGQIVFDEHGDTVGIGFSVYQVQNGIFVELN
jgi:branched-chain amino acid transport system substrate-binding protein